MFPDYPIAEEMAAKQKNFPPKKGTTSSLKNRIDELTSQVQQLQQEKKGLMVENERLTVENGKLKIKAEAFDELISSESYFPVNIVAKSFGWSAIKLNQYLQSKKVQYKHGDVWVLYQKYANKGYTREMWYVYGTNARGQERSRAHTYWTMKGIMFIRELLKADNLLAD